MGGPPPAPVKTEPVLGEVCNIISLPQLQKIINETPGVIVDFWGEGCPPCQKIKPTFAAAAKANENENLIFCACKTADARDAAMHFGINAIPNFIAFHNGKQFKNFKGANEPLLFQTIAELSEKIPQGKVVKAKQHEKLQFK